MSEPLSVARLGQILLRFWLMILVVTAVCAAAAYGATTLMPRTYSATATQLVKAIPGIGTTANYEAAQYAVARAKSYPSFIYSTQVLEGVMSDMGGTESVEDLRKDLSATNPADTPLVQLTATGRTPAEAQAKANSLARNLARFVGQIETVGGKTPVTVETAVQAALPEKPASPQVLLFVAVGAVSGFALASLAALALSRRRPTLRRRGGGGSRKAVQWWDEHGEQAEAGSEHERASRSQPVAPRESAAARTVPATGTPAPADAEPGTGNRGTSSDFAVSVRDRATATSNGVTSSRVRTKRL